MTLKTTPFHARTAPLCVSQAWRRWAGHVVASSYEMVHEREYHAIRSAAALFDVSPLYKYSITGKDAERLLDRIVTRNIAKQKVGQVVYTPWCDADGKIIDDGTVSRLGETEFRMTAADPSMRWLHLNAVGLDVRIEDVSEKLAALSLQGPNAREILKCAVDGDVASLKFFRLMRGSVRGIPVGVSRTGYTGDLGYEIWIDADQALPVWDAIVQAGEDYGIVPAGMLALDMARIEAALMLIEVDYVSAHHALIERQKSSPYEMNLSWTVDLAKPWFVGQHSLQAEVDRGIAWKFIGLDIDWTSLEKLYEAVRLPPKLPLAAWRVSVPVFAYGRQVGYATSGSWSPLLKKYIALAHVPANYAAPGTELEMEVTVEHFRRRARARVVKTPFFDPERKRG